MRDGGIDAWLIDSANAPIEKSDNLPRWANTVDADLILLCALETLARGKFFPDAGQEAAWVGNLAGQPQLGSPAKRLTNV